MSSWNSNTEKGISPKGNWIYNESVFVFTTKPRRVILVKYSKRLAANEERYEVSLAFWSKIMEIFEGQGRVLDSKWF